MKSLMPRVKATERASSITPASPTARRRSGQLMEKHQSASLPFETLPLGRSSPTTTICSGEEESASGKSMCSLCHTCLLECSGLLSWKCLAALLLDARGVIMSAPGCSMTSVLGSSHKDFAHSVPACGFCFFRKVQIRDTMHLETLTQMLACVYKYDPQQLYFDMLGRAHAALYQEVTFAPGFMPEVKGRIATTA